MFIRLTPRPLVALLLALGSLAPGLVGPDAAAASYTFINVADTTTAVPGGRFTSFSLPALSGSTAAFFGEYSFERWGIFTGAGGPLTTIVKTGDPAPNGTFTLVYSPAVSGDRVAFSGSYSGGSGIFSSADGALTTIAKSGDPAPSGTFQYFSADPALSGDRAAFQGNYAGGSGIFTGTGGALTTIVKTGDAAPSGTFTFVHSPALSGDTVAFQGNYSSGSSSSTGIFTGTGGALTTIVKTGDPAPNGTFTSVSSPAVSGDRAAFQGNYAGGNGIFTSAGGALTTIAKSGDPAPSGTFTGFGDLALSGGTAAFKGFYSGGSGLFTGSGGALTTVIKTGDSLFGSVLLDYSRNIDHRSLDPDGSGNLAFLYALADGRQGIAIAIATGLPGDFNHDDTVDAADYVVWRKGMGSEYTPNHYTEWRANFGRTAAGAAAIAAGHPAVPEPNTFALVALLIGIGCHCRLARQRGFCRHLAVGTQHTAGSCAKQDSAWQLARFRGRHACLSDQSTGRQHVQDRREYAGCAYR